MACSKRPRAPPRSLLCTVTIDLSQAITGKWDQPSTDPGKGVYDPEKWAVVFKYSSVNVRTNTVIKFKNHPSRAPVVWLVSGDVVIAGSVSVAGSYFTSSVPAEAGPGGYRGGQGAQGNLDTGSGFGLGGGTRGAGTYFYGNSRIIPLMGGSGGAGSGANSGSGGGGAILIATRGRAEISGSVDANGLRTDGVSWGSSGGAIRLIANEVNGRGVLQAVGSSAGKVRIEAGSYSGSLTALPPTIVVQPELLPTIWPSASAPQARIISVAGKSTPADPRANLDAAGSDLTFQDDLPLDIVVETKNMDVDASTVNIRITPRNGPAQLVKATFDSGTTAQARWVATTKIPQGFAALQVRAVGP